MSIVRSVWTTAINVNLPFNSALWAGAGQLALPVGSMLVKNDNQFAYIALDLTGDTGNSPGTSDYFWLTFDVDRNRAISPHVDVNYSIYPTLPIKIGHQFYLGPNTWTGLQPGPTQGIAHQTFGPSAASATPHRIWQLRVPLSEIGVTIASTPQDVPFGVRVASSTPPFVHDSPANFFADFSHLHDLIFALGPDDPFGGLAGITLAGVGNIPATTIDASGRATTAAAYVPHVENAAFSGVLNILGNNVTMHSLWTAGARKYRILHRLGTAGAFTHFRQTWANYHWVGITYVLESFGPDASDMYPFPNPSDDYSIQKLLLQWNSLGDVNGVHQFQVEFFNAANAPVASPAQTLTLLLDNAAPDVQILGIRYKGIDYAACDFITTAAPPAPIQVHIKAFDTPGDMLSYGVTAYYGLNQFVVIASFGYPGGNWQGTADQWVDTPAGFPPQTCAYQFRLSANKRVTNGYGYVGYWEFNDHVTIIKS
jgi:hypothetical protein